MALNNFPGNNNCLTAFGIEEGTFWLTRSVFSSDFFFFFLKFKVGINGETLVG